MNPILNTLDESFPLTKLLPTSWEEIRDERAEETILSPALIALWLVHDPEWLWYNLQGDPTTELKEYGPVLRIYLPIVHTGLVDTMQFYWSLSNTLCTLPISNPIQTPRFFLLECKNERGVLISNCSKSLIFLFQWISVRVWLGITWVISSENSETTCIAGFVH